MEPASQGSAIGREAAMGQCQGQQSAHAVAEQGGTGPGDRQDRLQRRLEPPGDVVGQREPPLRLAGEAPLDQERPVPAPRQISQQGALLGEVEHVAAVDQGGRDQDRETVRRGAGHGPVVEQQGRTVLPAYRRLGDGSSVGMVAIGLDAGQEPVEASAHLLLHR
jgi:hypothetical protein